MPELPEIHTIAKQLNRKLRRKSVTGVEVRQAKCLNKPHRELRKQLEGREIASVDSKGKWIRIRFEKDVYALLNLGMGANVLYHTPKALLPEKYQIGLTFDDESSLTIRFWWFGHFHAVDARQMQTHKAFSSLGADAHDRGFTLEKFLELLNGRKGAIKAFMLNQKHIAGIGNGYIHDILFKARLHPGRKISQISLPERRKLFDVIKQDLADAIKSRGLAFERDIYNRRGLITEFMVGYAAGKPCPKCKTEIRKIKTGSTSSYICPACQA